MGKVRLKFVGGSGECYTHNKGAKRNLCNSVELLIKDNSIQRKDTVLHSCS